jgi:PEP-CTERM motif
MMKYTHFCLTAAAAFVLCSSAQANSVTFAERLLPTSNINTTSSTVANIAIPSNYDFGYNDENNNPQTASIMIGDNFVTPTSPEGDWHVDAFSVWGVSMPGSLAPLPAISSLTLYVGSNGVLNPVLAAANALQVTYGNGQSYVATGDLATTPQPEHALYQITFTPTNLVLNGGTAYEFGISSTDPFFQIHACRLNSCVGTNAVNDGNVIHFWPDSGTYTDWPLQGPLADGTPVDINFQASGGAVPEPSTWMLLGAGLSALALARRRR